MGDTIAVDLARSNTATAAKAEGRFDLARSLLEQVLEGSQRRGDIRGVASALNGLGEVAASQRDHASARRYHHQSLAKYEQIGDRWGVAAVLADLAGVDLRAGDYESADGLLRQALQAFRELGYQRGVARQLETLARCAGARARDRDAVALVSAATAIRTRIGAPRKPDEQEQLDHWLAETRARSGADAYADAWHRGQTAPLGELIGSA
jgi:tetratricopeptide (TPR) repeat protein